MGHVKHQVLIQVHVKHVCKTDRLAINYGMNIVARERVQHDYLA